MWTVAHERSCISSNEIVFIAIFCFLDYNPDKENKILIVFDDMIADMGHKKKLNLIATELFIRGRKLNIFSCFYYPIIV